METTPQVTFTGVGRAAGDTDGLQGTDVDVGFATQFAVFSKRVPDEDEGAATPDEKRAKLSSTGWTPSVEPVKLMWDSI
jgi:hypothetical protein